MRILTFPVFWNPDCLTWSQRRVTAQFSWAKQDFPKRWEWGLGEDNVENCFYLVIKGSLAFRDIQLVWSGSTFFFTRPVSTLWVFINVLTEINTILSFVMSRPKLLPFSSYTYICDQFLKDSLKDAGFKIARNKWSMFFNLFLGLYHSRKATSWWSILRFQWNPHGIWTDRNRWRSNSLSIVTLK